MLMTYLFLFPLLMFLSHSKHFRHTNPLNPLNKYGDKNITYGSRADCRVGVAVSKSISSESCSLLERSDSAIAAAMTPSLPSTSVGPWIDRTLVTATLCVLPYKSTTANTRCKEQTIRLYLTAWCGNTPIP